MLFLFVPLYSKAPAVEKALQSAFSPPAPSDPRASTGVHFFMFYRMLATDKSRIVVPTFTPAPAGAHGPKDLLVVISIYDDDFEPYISAFLTNDFIVAGLNELLKAIDESGIVPDTDKSSAKYILEHGGVKANAHSFFKLLMRYNFADPTVPAVGPGGVANPPVKPWPYQLGATFPGLTVGMFLKPLVGYPDALQLWPAPGVAPKIEYEPSSPPPTPV
jgi:hypothetical protein